MDSGINKIDIFSNVCAKQHLELNIEILKKDICAASNFLKIELFIQLASEFPKCLMMWHFHWEKHEKEHCGYHSIDIMLYLHKKKEEKGNSHPLSGLIKVVTCHPPNPTFEVLGSVLGSAGLLSYEAMII